MINECGCEVIRTNALNDIIKKENGDVKKTYVIKVKRCPACEEYVKIRNSYINEAYRFAEKGGIFERDKRYLARVDELVKNHYDLGKELR